MNPNHTTFRIDDARVSDTAAELAANDAAPEGVRRRRERDESEWDRLFSRVFFRMTGGPVGDPHSDESSAAEPRAGSIEERLAYETHAGRLVPVVGPALSSRGIIGVSDRQRQARQEAGEHRVNLLRLLWNSEEYWAPRIVGESFNQRVMMWPQACEVLLGLRDDEHGDAPNPAPPVGPPGTLVCLEKLVDLEFAEPSKAKLVRLQLHLARLLAAATRIWASGLRKRPTILGTQYPHQVVKIDRLSVWNPDEIDVFWTALEGSLDAALALANHFGWSSEEPLVIQEAEKRPLPLGNGPRRPNLGAVLLPPEVYLALLLFMTEMGADQNRFAPHPETYRRAMNTGMRARVRVEADAVGIRERHLRWVATLLHHTLIAPTQAHRGRRELAFVVSLAKLRAQTDFAKTPTSLDVPDLPDAAALDPWPPDDEEMLGSPATVVRDVLVLTTYSEDGKIMREPSRAASAVATLSRWALMKSGDCRPPKPAGGLIFVTALDLEIELALASKGPHCVLIPVWMGEEARRGASPRAEWLLGRWVESDAAAYDPRYPQGEWMCLDASQAEDTLWDDGSGPLVVKLHGSPLHGLPEGERLVVSHRLTLGALDVLSMLLNDPVPRKVWAGYSQQESNNQRKSNPNTLFFLGHDVSSWDGRATWLRLAHPAAPNTERTARREGVDPELEFAFLNMQAKPVIRESKSTFSFESLTAILGRVG